MARAATESELEKLRSDQRSKLFAAVLKPEAVYSARVNQTVFDNPLAEVRYDDASGTLEDVAPGMTVYVGTSAGARDVGIARVRKAPSLTVLYIGETSEIVWADDLYLTVVREFGLWQRHLRTIGKTAYMDYDLTYTNQHTVCAPVVVMGPPRVAWLENDLASMELSSAGSWVPGSSVASVLWSAPGASATADLDTETPSVQYDSAGTYWVSCSVTGANGAEQTRWLPIFIFDDEHPPLEVAALSSCEMSRESGGWSFEISVYDGADLDAVRERALCVLFSQDWYGSEAGSIGSLAGAENLLAWGWIGTERIRRRARAGLVDFSVWGPAQWLSKITGYPVGLENTSGTANAWTKFHDLTVDAALWHMATWRTTMSLCMDVIPSGDTRLAPALEAPVGTLWSQMLTICHDTILAEPLCDRYGRLFVEVPVWALPVAERTAIPVVLDLDDADWTDEMNIDHNPIGSAAMVEASGVAYDGSSSAALFSHAPGSVISRLGGVETFNNLLLDDQDQLNELAGLIYAHENNLYPVIDIELAENNRFIDVAPRQRIAAPIAAGDTPRGISAANLYLLPQRVGVQFDVKSGSIAVSIEAEGETSGAAGVTYIPPAAKPDVNINPYDPTIPTFDPLPGGNTWFPGVIPTDTLDACKDNMYYPGNGPHTLHFDKAVIGAGESARAYYPCSIRSGSALNPTYIKLMTDNVSSLQLTVTGIDAAGNPLVTATLTGARTLYARFAPVEAVSVAGFMVTVAEDAVGVVYATQATFDDSNPYGVLSNLQNILGEPDQQYCTYTIEGGEGAQWIKLIFGRSFPNGGTIRPKGVTGQQNTGSAQIFAQLNEVTVASTPSFDFLQVSTEFDSVVIFLDPFGGGTVQIDAVAVESGVAIARLEDSLLYNVCAP